MNTTSLTGISTTEFTFPDGRELPELNWETEGSELRKMLREIDQVLDTTPWGRWGDSHKDWYGAWSDEFRRIRKQMGIFDPYSQTF